MGKVEKKRIELRVVPALYDAINAEAGWRGDDVSHTITRILWEYFKQPSNAQPLPGQASG